jgi:hypothetical protein
MSMSATTLSFEQTTDTEISRLIQAGVNPARLVELQRSYLAADENSYTRHHFDPSKLAKAEAELAEIKTQCAELEAQYTGWPRYYHVQNVNGHIHTSMSCSSCFFDTQFGWRTDLSGLTPEQVVKLEAYNACTVCMPIAPAEQKAARLSQKNEAKAARAAERKAKTDAKEAKAAARAIKVVDKVEEAIAKLGGREVFAAEYSDYGKDGLKSIYGLSWKRPELKITETTEGLLSFIKIGDWLHKPNAAITAELKKRNLI